MLGTATALRSAVLRELVWGLALKDADLVWWLALKNTDLAWP